MENYFQISVLCLSLASLIFLHFKGLFVFRIFADERITARDHISSLEETNDKNISLWKRFWMSYSILTSFLIFVIIGEFIASIIMRRLGNGLCIIPNWIGNYMLPSILLILSIVTLAFSWKLRAEHPFSNKYRKKEDRLRYLFDDILNVSMRVFFTIFMITLSIYPNLNKHRTLWSVMMFFMPNFNEEYHAKEILCIVYALVAFIVCSFLYLHRSTRSRSYKRYRI